MAYQDEAARIACITILVVPMGVRGSSVLSLTLLAVYTNNIVSQLPFSVRRFTQMISYSWHPPLLN